MSLESLIRFENVLLFVLVLARVSGIFLTAPLFSNRAVPNRIKILMILSLTFLMVPLVPSGTLPTPQSAWQILILLAQELAIGIVIGFVAYLIFASIQAAGELLGLQVGFSIAVVFDPTTEASSGVLTTLYVVVGALLFIILDGHHMILNALAKSFAALPLSGSVNWNIGLSMTELSAKVVVIGIQFAAPLLVVITAINIIFGFLTKLSPQMNIYFNIGFIVSPILGILILMLTLPLFRALLTGLTESMNEDLFRVLRELRGT